MSRHDPAIRSRGLPGRIKTFLLKDLSNGNRRKSRTQRGVALIAVTVMLTVIMAVTSQFVYKSEINHASAKNLANELKAHYLAKSVINLTRLMLKVQDKVIDRNRAFLGDIQLTDFIQVMLPAFFGQGSELLGFALGADPKDIRGLEFKPAYGTASLQPCDKDGKVICSEDGKINVNCAYVRSDQDPQVQRLAMSLMALFADQRYNPIFETQDDEGNYNDRETIVRAIIDYVDADEARYGQSTGAEDYGYETLKDPYKAKNNMMDSVDELRLVRGINEVFWANFGDSLTVYGYCIPNICAIPDDNWLLMASILVSSAQNPQDPALQDPIRLKALSKTVLQQVKFGGCTDLNTVVTAAKTPLPLSQILGITTQPDETIYAGTLQGIDLDPQKLSLSAYMGPRRFYRFVAKGDVDGVVKRITVIWDQQFQSPSTGQLGGYVYWREE